MNRRSDARTRWAAFVLLAVLAGCAKADTPSTSETTPTAPGGDFTVARGFGTEERGGTAGGESPRAARCEGHFPDAPQHRLVLDANMLAMTLETDVSDVVLWIEFGDNAFCGGSDGPPVRIGRGAWSAGTYSIRVGTRTAGARVPYVLRLREGI